MSQSRILILMFAVVLSLLVASVVRASGIGDCTVQLNGGANVAYGGGYVNTLDIWILNDSPLYGISTAFRISSSVPLTFLTHGTQPPANPIIQVHNDAVGKFDAGFSVLNRLNGSSPDTFGVGGVASTQPLPINVNSRLCYTLQFTIASNSTITNGISIDNIFIPPSLTWTFVDAVTSYAPNYTGQPNASQTNPSAPAVLFNIVPRPTQNGDVNCDGLRNISDAVYLINWIFSGGMEPCPN